jgi:hypothetical protein
MSLKPYQRRFYKKLIAGADARFDEHLATLKAAGASKQVMEKDHGKKSKDALIKSVIASPAGAWRSITACLIKTVWIASLRSQ